VALEWLCTCDQQADASGVRRCQSCEPMWVEPGAAPRPVQRREARGSRGFDPDDMEDLADGSPYIWDIPGSE
jgi:hypothetical protein